MLLPKITDREFSQFRELIYDVAGISMSPAKKALVCGRLARRLREYRLESYGEYFDLVIGKNHPQELQTAVDLLTTNETSFFREPSHFDYLRDVVLREHSPGRLMSVWSAASSSGEEAYSIAMTLAHHLGDTPWQVIGSDISTRVLERARTGLYPMERSKTIPRRYLVDYCLRGVGDQAGKFMIDAPLRQRVRFEQINLTKPVTLGIQFDVIFLRNVLIYFDVSTKRKVVAGVLEALKPGGHFIIGHSESLQGVASLKAVRPSIYRNE